MPPPRKPAERRQNNITRDIRLEVVPKQEGVAIPRAPKGLHVVAQRAWRRFWLAPIAAMVDADSDMPALERWAYCVSERARLAPVLKKTPLLTGSQGQLVSNPLAAQIRDLTREILTYESRFGMTPSDRLKMGVVYGQAHDALAALNVGPDEPEVFDMAEFADATATDTA